MSNLPRYRRDYLATELDDRPLILLRSLAPDIVVWTGRHPQTLQAYLEARLQANRAATAYTKKGEH